VLLSGVAAVLAVGTSMLSSPAEAIVGGTPSSRSEYPYIVKVGRPRLGDCTGTLVGAEWVLTAAHCVTEENSNILLGPPEDYAMGLSHGPRVGATEIRVHPLWNGDHKDGHDLALVRIRASVTVGVPRVQVGQPFEQGPYLPQEATIVGYGTTGLNNHDGGVLRAADTPLRADDYMADIYAPWWAPFFGVWNWDLMIGAGSTGQTICYGDSGGPLLARYHSGHPIQVGVASFVGVTSRECDVPGGYMELNGAQLAWVATVVPEVAPSWGDPCTTVHDTLGHPTAVYAMGGSGLSSDGPYRWTLKCDGPPAPPQPNNDPGTPEGPPPMGCRRTC
jgi:hypothetical protein